jgi:hypothetical protein
VNKQQVARLANCHHFKHVSENETFCIHHHPKPSIGTSIGNFNGGFHAIGSSMGCNNHIKELAIYIAPSVGWCSEVSNAYKLPKSQTFCRIGSYQMAGALCKFNNPTPSSLLRRRAHIRRLCRLRAEDFCCLVSRHIFHIIKIVKKEKLGS